MANASLFRSIMGRLLPATDAVNEAGGPAYALDPKHALAQYAATGCLHSTYYADAATQLGTVLAMCDQVDAEFIARTAVFARERGHMKDMPALLAAVLSRRAPALLEAVFDRVVDDGRMLRSFVQIMRSGAVGRKSLGSLPKRQVRRWLAQRTDEQLVRASVGQDPSLADVVRMVHPKPATPSRQALYGWLVGKPHAADALPAVVRRYEAWKAEPAGEVPDVPFQLLTALPLGRAEWARIAERASWQTTRMNLNTFARHGVFEVPGLTERVAARLRDRAEIERARVFPYQLLAAHGAASSEVPGEARRALEDAMEVAIERVPAVPGRVYVCPDVSGSMRSPVTGHRRGATSRVRCVDVAALVAAAVLKKNPDAEVLPFHDRVLEVRPSPRDTVLTNASLLASVGGGGTNCSAPLARLNAQGARGDLVMFVSDNQSWMDATHGRSTATLREWGAFKHRNPAARLVCIDVQPYGTTQAAEREDVLNVGGFSDQVFEVVAEFAAGRLSAGHWIGLIERVTL